jgi:hypothetical protein
LVNKENFLVDRFKAHQIEIHFNPKSFILREPIIERAKKFQFEDYDILDFNCKIFVEYLLFDIEPPKRKVQLKQFQVELCDITIAMFNLQLRESSNAKYAGFIKKQIEDTEEDKMRFLLSIEELKFKRVE